MSKPIKLRIPDSYMEKMDRLIELGYFMNRSEVIREAIRREMGRNKHEE